MSLLDELREMHTYARPYGSATERAFIARYIAPLPNATEDAYGNWHVTVGESHTLWSCHTDTVHRAEGRQTLHYDTETGILQLSRRSRKRMSCLGADDTVGVFLMRNMVLAGVRGHYIFHFGEEVGGIGSRALALQHEDLLRTFDRAIALDRAGYSDIITSQMWDDTASDTFATALAEQLEPSGSFRPCAGVYTDTAEYAHIIPECSNISVGYFNAHSKHEYVDTAYVLWLLKRLCAIDAELLPTVRNPHDHSLHTVLPFLSVRSDISGEQPYTQDELDAMSEDELETNLDFTMWREQWDRAEQLQDEQFRRNSGTSDLYLDPDYADVLRATHHMIQKVN
jgi:hypothetical protein